MIAKNGRIGVFGGNRVGKSTFNRWLINKFLDSIELGKIHDVSSVIYVDLDPGQAEFTPPGVISVLKISEPVVGPNYTHLETPILYVDFLDFSVSLIRPQSCIDFYGSFQIKIFRKLECFGLCKNLC